MYRIAEMTNATKAQIIVFINAIFGILTAFNIELSDAKEGAILVLVNASLGLWVAFTYNSSRKRQEETTQ
jgi:hypothetical protein